MTSGAACLPDPGLNFADLANLLDRSWSGGDAWFRPAQVRRGVVPSTRTRSCTKAQGVADLLRVLCVLRGEIRTPPRQEAGLTCLSVRCLS